MSKKIKYGINLGSKDLMITLAQRTKELRKSHGFSRNQFSEKSGVSASTIKKFETTGVISLESFFRICKALDRLTEFKDVLLPKSEDQHHLFDI